MRDRSPKPRQAMKTAARCLPENRIPRIPLKSLPRMLMPSISPRAVAETIGECFKSCR